MIFVKKKRPERERKWRKWFAWRPVKLSKPSWCCVNEDEDFERFLYNGKTAWLQYVERNAAINLISVFGLFYTYREIKD